MTVPTRPPARDLARPAAAWLAMAISAAVLTALADRRPPPADLRADYTLTVDSARDAGPGSLRRAILDADRMPGTVRIVLAVPEIRLARPLPALINPHGIVIDGEARGESTAIDLSRLGFEPAFDLADGPSTLVGLSMRGARDHAVLVRAAGARLVRCRFIDCAIAVGAVGDGIAAAGDEGGGLRIESCDFEAGDYGVRLQEVAAATVRDNRFRGHREAAVWVAGGGELRVEDNVFDDDRIAVLSGAATAVIAGNRIAGAREAGVYLLGGAATVRANRISAGGRGGIVAERAVGARIEGNEIDHQAGAAIAMMANRAAVVRANRIYGNGAGILDLFGNLQAPSSIADNLLLAQRGDAVMVMAGSPRIVANRIFANRGAGIRLLAADGAPSASPALEANRFAANGAGAVAEAAP